MLASGQRVRLRTLDVVGTIQASTVALTSDIRLKTNIIPLTGGTLRSWLDSAGVSFEWNDEYKALGRGTVWREIGVIAQDIEAVFPELVTTWGAGYKAVDYSKLSGVLIEAIKELTDQHRRRSWRRVKMHTSQRWRRALPRWMVVLWHWKAKLQPLDTQPNHVVHPCNGLLLVCRAADHWLVDCCWPGWSLDGTGAERAKGKHRTGTTSGNASAPRSPHVARKWSSLHRLQ